MLQPLARATAHRMSTPSCFLCQRISRRVLHAPASTPTGMQPYPTRRTPPQPIPTPSIAHMQLLHPPLRCSKKIQKILVIGRKHDAAGAQTKTHRREVVGERRGRRRRCRCRCSAAQAASDEGRAHGDEHGLRRRRCSSAILQQQHSLSQC